MPTQVVTSIADALEATASQIGVVARVEFDRTRRPMFEEMGARLSQLVEQDVFGDQASPAGIPWRRISPLTKAIREETGQGGSTQLGVGPRNALRNSFKIGGQGNVFRVRRNGFTFGSQLRKGSAGVAASFQDTYIMPKSTAVEASPGGGFQVDVARDPGTRIRRWMGATVGVHAPAPGNVLHHPGRQLLDWSPEWIDEMRRIALKWLRIAVENVALGQTAPHRTGEKPNTEARALA